MPKLRLLLFQNMYGDIERLRASDKYLSELAILLWPLLVVQQEIRFFTVDQENTEKHYEVDICDCCCEHLLLHFSLVLFI